MRTGNGLAHFLYKAGELETVSFAVIIRLMVWLEVNYKDPRDPLYMNNHIHLASKKLNSRLCTINHIQFAI